MSINTMFIYLLFLRGNTLVTQKNQSILIKCKKNYKKENILNDGDNRNKCIFHEERSTGCLAPGTIRVKQNCPAFN